MTSNAATPEQYLRELPAERKEPVTQLRNTILKNLPKGFKEVMGYGMISSNAVECVCFNCTL